MVPNSQRKVFTSNDVASYWKKVQKLLNFVGSGKIGRVPDPGLFSTPSYNKHLALPTTGIVSAAISSKT